MIIVQTPGDGVSKDLSGGFGGGADPLLVTGKICASIGQSSGVSRHVDVERRALRLVAMSLSSFVAMAFVVVL